MGTLETVKPIIFIGSGLAFLIFGAGLLLYSRKAAAGIALIASLFLFLMPKLENVAEIQATATGLTLKLAEASSVLERLRKLASLTGKSLAEIQLNAGSIGGPSARDRDRLEAEINSNLTSIAADSRDIEYVRDLYRKRDFYDYTVAINEHYLYYVHNGQEDPNWRAAFQAVAAAFPPSPEALESLVKQFNAADEFTSKLLGDYRMFLASGKHADQEFWADRDRWPTEMRESAK